MVQVPHGQPYTGFAISKPYRRGLVWYVRTREGNTAVGNDRSGGGVDEKERKLSIVVAVARPPARTAARHRPAARQHDSGAHRRACP